MKNWINPTLHYLKIAAASIKTKIQIFWENMRIRKRVWYVILGSAHAGKTHFIQKMVWKNNNLLSHVEKKLVSDYSQHHWYFNDPVSCIEIDFFPKNRETVLRCFNKIRGFRIAGVFLCLDFAKIMTLQKNEAQVEIQDLVTLYQHFRNIIKRSPLFHLICTHADKIIGFQEWGEEGFYVEIKNDCALALSEFITNLQNKAFSKLAEEKDLMVRKRIFNFPKTLSLLNNLLLHWLNDFQKALNVPMPLRTILFISSALEKASIDPIIIFLKQHHHFDFVDLVPVYQKDLSKTIASWFQKKYQSDARKRVYDKWVALYKKQKMRVHTLLSGVFFVFSLFWMYHAYSKSEAIVSNLNALVVEYEASSERFENSVPQWDALLPLLNPLQKGVEIFQTLHGATKATLYSTLVIEHAVLQAYQRVLITLFLPRVAWSLDHALRAGQPTNEALYGLFKAYLAFSTIEQTPANFITAPIDALWNRDFKGNVALITDLEKNLNFALQNDVPPLPLDPDLIQKTRNQLNHIAPAERAYSLLLLKTPSLGYSDLYLKDKWGALNNTLFENLNTIKMEVLYSNTGYRKIFLKYAKPLLQSVLEDHLDEIISDPGYHFKTNWEDLETLYFKNANAAWLALDQSLRWTPWNSFSEAVAILNLLAQKHSPIMTALSWFDHETRQLQNTNNSSIKNISDMHQFIRNQWNGVTFSTVLETLKKLSDYFSELRAQKDIPLACLASAKSYIENDAKNPLAQFATQIEKAPYFIQIFLKGILHSAWTLIADQARQQLDALWKTEVVSADWDLLTKRYPFQPNAAAEITIPDFARLLNPNGTLAQFYNNNLTTFLNTHEDPWKEYAVEDQKLGLSAATLALFHALHLWQSMYFSNDALHLQFTLTPQTLSNTASTVQLVFGNTTIRYAHGPLQPRLITWPFNPEKNKSSLLITTLDGKHFTQNYEGDWSLLRLLQTATWKMLAPARYQIDFTLNGQTASFIVSGLENADVLNPDFFSHIIWPQQLGSTS